MDWFLCDRDLRHKRIKPFQIIITIINPTAKRLNLTTKFIIDFLGQLTHQYNTMDNVILNSVT